MNEQHPAIEGPSASDEHCDRLIHAYLDETLAAGEEAEFEKLMRESRAARERFWELAEVHGLAHDAAKIVWGEAGEAEPREIEPREAASRDMVALGRETLSIGLSPRALGRTGLAMAIALTLALLLWATWPQPSHEPASTAASRAIAWVDTENPPRVLRAGDRLRQADGQTELRFDSGVSLTLSGDADLELISAMSVRLYAGQLQADVGETGRGFRVLTDSTDVVDLGTVFGVGVNPTGETDVVVFDGEVELSRRQDGGSGRGAQRYTTGEAVRVESGGEKTRISTIWQRTAGSRWSTDGSRDADFLITSVGDNLSTESRPKFYSIVPGGFREGARAYVDRTHTWSGLGEESLPEMLVGGDYIQTFNDDKVESEIEISMTVSRPSRIYLLVDSRMPTPDWLERDFANTGQRLAMSTDVAAKEKQVPPEVLAQRHSSYGTRYVAGRWEFVFSVWMREVPDGGEVRLGPCKTLSAMYGIVAVGAEAGG